MHLMLRHAPLSHTKYGEENGKKEKIVKKKMKKSYSEDVENMCKSDRLFDFATTERCIRKNGKIHAKA